MLSHSSTIVLLGSGNVATQLGLALKKAGHPILQVYGRTTKSARTLALKLRAQPVTVLKKISAEADLYILAVKDDVVATLVKHLPLKHQLIVHTSGTLPISVLKGVSSNFGVLYPLQTLSKNKLLNFTTVPLCIEGNTAANEQRIRKVARSVSGHVHTVPSEQRKVLHLAAVFAGNFSNHMYVIAEQILREHHLPFELLLPLIRETSDKVNYGSPRELQTGPAIRNDRVVMNAHLKMLSSEKELKNLYRAISQHILRPNLPPGKNKP